MEKFASTLFCLLALGLSVSCTVISSEIRSGAEPPLAFSTLVDQADRYIGRTVILGGYILETRNKKSETVIEVLQVPMRIGEEPDLKDSSQGRFQVIQRGFLDPEIYRKDRVITVAGSVIGSGEKAIGDDRIRYLKIENREIYLWPEFQQQTSAYPYSNWRHPYFWYRHPVYHHPYWYW